MRDWVKRLFVIYPCCWHIYFWTILRCWESSCQPSAGRSFLVFPGRIPFVLLGWCCSCWCDVAFLMWWYSKGFCSLLVDTLLVDSLKVHQLGVFLGIKVVLPAGCSHLHFLLYFFSVSKIGFQKLSMFSLEGSLSTLIDVPLSFE